MQRSNFKHVPKIRKMKIIRSTKCSVKFATKKKKQELQVILKEYGRVVNCFIDYLWTNPTNKAELLKPIIDIPKTWLSYRLKLVAAREAIDMISSAKEILVWNKEQLKISIDSIGSQIQKLIKKTNTKESRKKINNLYNKLKRTKSKLKMVRSHKPKHKGNRMCVSNHIALLQTPKEQGIFNAWLHLFCIGNKISMNIPIKFHKHYLKLNKLSKRLNSYIVTNNYIQFAFERETGLKKEVKNIVGIDTGINAMASTSDGKQFGTDIKRLIEKVKRCKYGSKGKQRAINALKQRIDEIAKEVVKNADLIVVEKLKNLNNNSKLKGRLSKNIRSSIGSWNYRYWLNRVESNCEESRTSFRTVLPYYTSQKCPISTCGHIDSKNRIGEVFKCQSCGYTGNADLVAALNIKERFLTGKYGSCYKL